MTDIYGMVVSLHFFLFCGVRSKLCIVWKSPSYRLDIQMSLVIVSKFNFENMLKSIQRYKITHLT